MFSTTKLAAGLSAGLLMAGAGEAAADGSVAGRLDARGIVYQVDDDGDYKVTYNYSDQGRSQLVFVSGSTQTVAGFTVREVFSPAARINGDGIDGAKALELLAESRRNKLGSWEISGDVLYFVVKLPENLTAAQLESAMDVVAETADDMEMQISGHRDDL